MIIEHDWQTYKARQQMDKMTDEEKSKILLRLCGLVEMVGGCEYVRIWYLVDNAVNHLMPLTWVNIYKERYMALARHVLNWAVRNLDLEQSEYEDVAMSFAYHDNGMRWSLDKILELAMEGGMLQDDH